jgi:hypothetical protein
MLSTHLLLGLPSGLFHSGFPTNVLYAFLAVIVLLVAILTHFFSFNFIFKTKERQKTAGVSM